jgi:hypothetical protein
MKTTLLIMLAVVMVGCSKKNPPKPEAAMFRGFFVTQEGLEATREWYNSLVVCLHCGSDLARKGAKTCPEWGVISWRRFSNPWAPEKTLLNQAGCW